ncbi:MAG: phosphoribosylanthranilate isomerase [Lachnospiraceae bacterium]|nr:phosphoribosylanthranilate isomerase [Lachnospiraceae bacterium]
MKIKICGLTSSLEAVYLNEQQIDFAGMVLFFPKSKRNITIAQAKEIMKALRPEIQKVAVVVSPDLQEVREIEAAGFDYIQIHGELTEELLSEIHLPILKAFNVTDMSRYEQYHQCEKIAGYVFDACEPGSGKTFDWSLVQQIPGDEKLLLLAGGLHAGNVAEAIRYVHPDGVDVSSGVEKSGGCGKDPKKIKAFVDMVRQAQ